MRSAVTPVSSAGDNVKLGIVSILTAVFVFAMLNVLVKWLSARYPVVEVAFFRSLFALIPTAVMVAMNGGVKILKTQHIGSHIWRASVGLVSMILLFFSFSMLPLADAVAISFSAPLFLTALAVPLLGEKVGIHRWTAVLVGFIGVLIMVRPGGDVLNLGALVGVTSAVFYALAMISIRRLSRTESSITIIFYFALFGSLFTGLLLPFNWVTPTPGDLVLMILLGLTGGIGQYFMTQAYRYAPAGVISPFNYSAILWATLFGFLIWGDVPDAILLFGAVIVIGSGLYILHRETRRRVSVVKTAGPVARGAD